jgi:hypothetical protein
MGRESYTTLVGSTPVSPGEDVPMSKERSAHGFSQDPTAVRANPDILVSVCDWDPGFWFIVFPPIPIPLMSHEDTPGLPNTTLVRLTFESSGSWRAQFANLSILGPGGERAAPIRYRIVLADKAESLGDVGTHAKTLEPCSRAVEPKKSVDRAHMAVLEAGELWLVFDTSHLPEKGVRTLALDGISRNDLAVPVPHVTLDSGSRWFWYRFFP